MTKDPYMLLSIVNMKLRDEYPDLDDLCASMDIDRSELTERPSTIGYHYDPAHNAFTAAD